jgi:hypothetical protein
MKRDHQRRFVIGMPASSQPSHRLAFFQKPFDGCRPSAMRTFGPMISICCVKYGRHVSISTGVGGRFPGAPGGIVRPAL